MIKNGQPAMFRRAPPGCESSLLKTLAKERGGSMDYVDSEKDPCGKAYAVRDGAGPHDDGDVVRDLQGDLFP